MTYGRYPYGGLAYGGSDVAEIPEDALPILAVEVAFTTDALAEPAWVDVTGDVRFWDTWRGRNRELEAFQPGRATVVLDNRDRQYDSVNAAGPWFGNVKPMRRLRIRETFSGVTYPTFDGYVDRWQLDYPNSGKDATAVVTATDAFKIFARTDLPTSVYDDLVKSRAPDVYWRLDETKNSEADDDLAALNSGALGPAADGTYVGMPNLAGEALVVKDPGGSMELTNSNDRAGTGLMGVLVDGADFDIFGGSTTSFVFEAWAIPAWTGPSSIWLMENDGANSGTAITFDVGAVFTFTVTTSTGTYSVSTGVMATNRRYHVVGRFVMGQPLTLWINGVKTTGQTPAGTLDLGEDLHVGYAAFAAGSGNWVGPISHVSIYRGAAAEAFGDSDVADLYAAGTTPWQDDLPGVRIGRVLDETLWPDDRREVDTGTTTLQSAELAGQTTLDHLQKVADTEFGLLYVDRTGSVRFVERNALSLRFPDPGVVFGDGAGEVGYRSFVPDDGDQVIRNRATISRYNGVAKTAVDAASVDEHGRFDYTLEGLLHRSDAYSESYAEYIVTEYAAPRRRITTLALGPPEVGAEATLLPQMLGREIGDAIVVRSRPLGGGDPFEQTCVIEGVAHRGAPGGERETTWQLSPEFTLAPF